MKPVPMIGGNLGRESPASGATCFGQKATIDFLTFLYDSARVIAPA
jgi:hypothetical protein